MLGIDWKNGQAGGTPLSAENLKLMQSLIETEIANQVQDLTNTINSLKTNIVVGSEQTTNEFYNNKQVYVKRIDCGYLLNQGLKAIPHGLTNVTFVKVDGIAVNNEVVYPLSFVNSDYDKVGLWLDQNGIEIITYGDKTSFHAWVDLYYTKNNE